MSAGISFIGIFIVGLLVVLGVIVLIVVMASGNKRNHGTGHAETDFDDEIKRAEKEASKELEES